VLSKATEADPKSLVAWSTLGRLQGVRATSPPPATRTGSFPPSTVGTGPITSRRLLGWRPGSVGPRKPSRRVENCSPPRRGNVERHQEFAELCFNLGEVDEGLDALRRASRANPSDPKASNTLADALARQFRTEEAIELYWRAFDRTRDLDARLAVVSRLSEQYLQRNQFRARDRPARARAEGAGAEA